MNRSISYMSKKQKKKNIIFLLFFSFAGMFWPFVSHAAWWNWVLAVPTGGLSLIPMVSPAIQNAALNAAEAIGSAVMRFIAYLFALIAYTIADIVSKVADLILIKLLNKTITGNSPESIIFLNSWAIVRDWANLLIVIGFIGVAIATMLNFDKYKAQKLLVPLIIVALLVNFSIVFVGLVIDTSNIAMRSMTDGLVMSSMVKDADDAWHLAENNINGLDILTTQKNWKKTGTSATFGWVFIFLAISIGYLVLIFLQRYAILALLFILSPLAFVLFVFPIDKAKELFNAWWHAFLKWSFAGLGTAFCLKIAMQILQVFGSSNIGDLDLFDMIYQLVIVLIILVVGLRIAVKQSGPLADATIKIAKTAWTYGGKQTSKWIADNTGLTRAKNAAQYGLTRAGESLRLVNRGQAIATWQKNQRGVEIDDKGRQERTKHMDTQTKISNLRKGAITTAGHLDNAAILKSMTKEEMGLLSDGEQIQFMQKYGTYGAKPHEIADKLSTVNQNQLIAGLPGIQVDAKTKEVIMNSLAAKGQLDSTVPGSLSSGQIAGTMQEMLDNGTSVENVVKGLDKGNVEGMVTAGLFDPVAADRLFDPQTRNKIFNMISDKKWNVFTNDQQKYDALLEARTQQYKPKDIVNNMESVDLARLISGGAPGTAFANARTDFDEQLRTVAGNSLLKRGDLNLVEDQTPGLTPAAKATATAALRRDTVEEMMRNGIDIEEIEKLDHNYAPINRARIDRIRTANPGFTPAQLEQAARDEVLDRDFSKKDSDQLRGININELTTKRIKQLTPEKLEAAYQFADAGTKAHLKGIITNDLYYESEEAHDQYDDAMTSGETGKANKALDKYQKLDKLIQVIHDL